ncbi:hypothetical protein [Flavobacterium microcysteis]|uniref:Uncharacterized protein n=1 Tax=Flavobacterium microcysteis TaxID=2596891 RepID=A0A501QMV4_9FLAO|nr:hypothetical protein [Flavobacterium microcysteis]TPD73477.1 hypothetical protein FJA49_00935 [Flavobacterium microcysteis]
MKTKNVLLGIAAGVAAVAVARLILKKTGAWDSMCERASDIEDKMFHKGYRKRERESLSNLPKGEEKTVNKKHYEASKLKNAVL